MDNWHNIIVASWLSVLVSGNYCVHLFLIVVLAIDDLVGQFSMIVHIIIVNCCYNVSRDSHVESISTSGILSDIIIIPFSSTLMHGRNVELLFFLSRSGLPLRQLPDSAHPQPHPLPDHQSLPSQSIDADFSQQPGPSGLHLLSPPTQPPGDVHLSLSSSSGASEGQTVPETNAGGNLENFSSGPSLPGPSSATGTSPVFQIPLSQDILAHGATQDISVGFSQPGNGKTACESLRESV